MILQQVLVETCVDVNATYHYGVTLIADAGWPTLYNLLGV